MEIVTFEIDTRTYPLFIIRAAAYAFLDQTTTILSIASENNIRCQLIRKEGRPPFEPPKEGDTPFLSPDILKQAFIDELTTQAHYFSQLEHTKHITGPLILAALGGR
ncbi:hypothetical protein HY641_04850 [Candidatus Woesearchaeota archaeon]|nr:hypothetical protein [Candidatus Woesearchaeota archaeon]